MDQMLMAVTSALKFVQISPVGLEIEVDDSSGYLCFNGINS
jgi:hypothetical protein